jgi:hypothetical protein
MAERNPHAPLGETELALARLVSALEADDYRSSSGVKATDTEAFIMAKALVGLFHALGRPRWLD